MVYIYILYILHIEIGVLSALLTVMYTYIIGTYTCAYVILITMKTDYYNSDKCMHAHAEDVNKKHQDQVQKETWKWCLQSP